MHDSSEFDSKGLLDYLAGDRGFAADLIDIFFSDSAVSLEGIENCFSKGELEAVYEHIHALKGGAANIRATAFHSFMQELAEATLNRSPELAALIKRLRPEYERAAAVLSTWQELIRKEGLD